MIGTNQLTGLGSLLIVASCIPNTTEGPWGAVPVEDHFSSWCDSAQYESGMAQLDDIKLHYLDFGGTGDTLLFLAGGGQTAYVMSGLADRFRGNHRVLALTRRGTGESDHPESGYLIDDHASDIVGFLDLLDVAEVTLVGHSMAGAEMTRVAVLHPERVKRLVYLDATYDYEGYEAMVEANPHPRPTPRDFGWPTSVSLRDYNRVHVYGFWADSLEADLRVSFWHRPHEALISTFVEDAVANPNNYRAVEAPALAFWAAARFEDYSPGQARSASVEVRADIEEYVETVRVPWESKAMRRFAAEIRNGRLIKVTANHHFFIPMQDMVVEEMSEFFAENP